MIHRRLPQGVDWGARTKGPCVAPSYYFLFAFVLLCLCAHCGWWLTGRVWGRGIISGKVLKSCPPSTRRAKTPPCEVQPGFSGAVSVPVPAAKIAAVFFCATLNICTRAPHFSCC